MTAQLADMSGELDRRALAIANQSNSRMMLGQVRTVAACMPNRAALASASSASKQLGSVVKVAIITFPIWSLAMVPAVLEPSAGWKEASMFSLIQSVGGSHQFVVTAAGALHLVPMLEGRQVPLPFLSALQEVGGVLVHEGL